MKRRESFRHNLLTWVELGVILGFGWLMLWVAAIVDVGGGR